MTSIRVTAVVQTDGELRLSELPCQAGDQVEAILLLPDRTGDRRSARERFLARARAARLSSAGPYPSRDELHERP